MRRRRAAVRPLREPVRADAKAAQVRQNGHQRRAGGAAAVASWRGWGFCARSHATASAQERAVSACAAEWCAEQKQASPSGWLKPGSSVPGWSANCTQPPCAPRGPPLQRPWCRTRHIPRGSSPGLRGNDAQDGSDESWSLTAHRLDGHVSDESGLPGNDRRGPRDDGHDSQMRPQGEGLRTNSTRSPRSVTVIGPGCMPKPSARARSCGRSVCSTTSPSDCVASCCA